MKFTAFLFGVFLSCWSAESSPAADPPAGGGMTAADVAAHLRVVQQDGDSYIRLRLEMKPSTTLQLQIKSRRTEAQTDIICQVLFPREKKGEGVLLRHSSSGSSGFTLSPGGSPRPLDPSSWNQPLYGSDLCYEDLVDDFYAWPNQTLSGNETVDGVSCPILESRPGKSGKSFYGSVRTWVDTRRWVPLRVEKFSSSGKLLRRIDTTRVVNDDGGRHLPATLRITQPGHDSVTELEGSRIRRGMAYTSHDFSPEALQDLNAPKGGSE